MTIDLTVEMANQYALKAMMCSRAYVRDTDRTQFPVEGLGWKKVDIAGNPVPADQNSYTPCFLGRIFSNLQFDIWEKMDSEETIIAFKGTDEKIDWLLGDFALGISVPYKSAKKQVCKYIELNPRRNVSLTGHSLGGGLALSVSVWLGLDALVFNSSPRIFDGLRNMNEPADRKAVFQKGDVLQKLRANWPKFLEKVPSESIVQSHFDYHGESNHRMDLMAEGILRLADDPAYIAIAQAIPVKVAV